MFTPQVLDHFANPRNAGELADATVQADCENPACGDMLRLALRVNGEVIEDVRFLAKGCVPTIACASAMTELVRGRPVEQARRVTREEITACLGELPPASGHAAELALETLRKALAGIAPRSFAAPEH